MICESCGAAYQVASWHKSYRGTREYCARCYQRWADHGYPASGPPPLAQGCGGGPGAAARIEDYVFLRGRGLSRAAAALRLGITRRTIRRYDAALREGRVAA